jgi:cysteinyl-tRNA synthetase
MAEIVPQVEAGTTTLANISTLEDFRRDFKRAMDEDFNTPQALAIIFELIKTINREVDADKVTSLGTLSTMEKLITDLAGGVMGILPEQTTLREEGNLVEDLLQLLLNLRQKFREESNWQAADEIRDRLLDMGILIEDGLENSTWRIK